MARKLMQNEEISVMDEYFLESGDERSHIMDKLFDADSKNIKQKTELNEKEILIFAKMFFVDEYLKTLTLNPIFEEFKNEIMALKVSKNRQSRREFVEANKHTYDEQAESTGIADTLRKKLNLR